MGVLESKSDKTTKAISWLRPFWQSDWEVFREAGALRLSWHFQAAGEAFRGVQKRPHGLESGSQVQTDIG